MNTFRISALAIAIVLALNSFAAAQCNAGRQIDTTNLNLGLQGQAVQQSPCANGQCNQAPQVLSFTQPQTSVMVNAPRVAVRVGVQRAYQPLYVVTAPQQIVYQQQQYAQYAMVAPQGGSSSASSSAGAASSSASSSTSGIQAEVFGVQPEVLAFDPSVGVQVASVCSGGNCGGGRVGLLGRRGGRAQFIRAPRSRTRSVSVSRSG